MWILGEGGNFSELELVAMGTLATRDLLAHRRLVDWVAMVLLQWAMAPWMALCSSSMDDDDDHDDRGKRHAGNPAVDAGEASTKGVLMLRLPPAPPDPLCRG